MRVFEEVQGGVTTPKGFLAAGLHCGIKKVKKDLAILCSTVPAHAAATFTANTVPAAPLIVDKIQLAASPRARALVVNSGNANACTGERGLNDAWTMVKETAAALHLPPQEILVSSTGVIGQYLPMERLVAGIKEAAHLLSINGAADATQAIMTTDTFPKQVAVRVSIDGADVSIAAMAKGSGMIAPNMATMLAFVTTDAAITPAALSLALKDAVDRSFNRISVDGDTSTNDMVVVFANGLAGNAEIQSTGTNAYALFYEALQHVLTQLAKMIVVDGEGATKFIEVCVIGASTEHDAVKAGRAIANSNLVKTAIHGEDANWGRILAALGNSGVSFNPANVEIAFGNVPILRKNYHIDFSEGEAKRVLSQKEVVITVSLDQGNDAATFWTCDLTKEYVAINANYRT